jgi:serine/threonine protein kinase
MLYVYLNKNRYKVLSQIQDDVFLVEDQYSTCVYIAKKCGLHEHSFKTELNILSNMKSSFVPKLVDVFYEGNTQWFIETYIDGINGKEWIENRIPIYKKITLVLSILNILEEVHKLGYLYIDLKLENIIVQENQFYLIDFNACIERHSRIAYMASPSNCAPELLGLSCKDVEVDIYSLGSLIQALFKHNFILIYLCHLPSNKRIQSLKGFKRIFLIQWISKIILILNVLCLSVFLCMNYLAPKNSFDLYKRNRDVRLFKTAFESSKKEMNKDTLYNWILNDWIIDEVYQNKEAYEFLLDEAIKSNDKSIIRYVFEKQNECLDKTKSSYVLMILNPTSKSIDNCIHRTISSDYFLQKKIDVLKECLNTALVSHIYLNLEELIDYFDGLKTNLDLTDFGCTYLEYALLMKKEQAKELVIPDIFINNIKNDKWNDLYTLWRAST